VTRRARRRAIRDVIFVYTLILAGLVLLYVLLFGGKETSKDTSTEEVSTEAIETEKGYIVENNQTVIVDTTLYDVTCGYTFYEDKGNMKLYADIVPTTMSGSLMVTATEFHMGKEMPNGKIKEQFNMREDGLYVNSSGTVTINYTGLSATFEDNRKGVELPFNGTLQLLLSEANTNYNFDALNSVSLNNMNNSTETASTESSVGETKINGEEPVVEKVDPTEETKTETSLPSNDFTALCVPSNERKEFTITAKFVESCSNSGTKYVEANTGTVFYAFGQSYPYDGSTDTVTITAIYRGNEEHFNGLQMGGRYPCFVINSISKSSEN
jgi:hypothetical protein